MAAAIGGTQDTLFPKLEEIVLAVGVATVAIIAAVAGGAATMGLGTAAAGGAVLAAEAALATLVDEGVTICNDLSNKYRYTHAPNLTRMPKNELDRGISGLTDEEVTRKNWKPTNPE